MEVDEALEGGVFGEEGVSNGEGVTVSSCGSPKELVTSGESKSMRSRISTGALSDPCVSGIGGEENFSVEISTRRGDTFAAVGNEFDVWLLSFFFL